MNSADIAIVGMAARLPGADTLATFWTNLRDGVESIRDLSEADLIAAGEDPARLADPAYVRRAAVLDGFDRFDPDFFGFSPREAAILDPQHRLFLELAWEALETAAHPPETFPGRIGVWAGCGMGSYFHQNLCTNPDLVRSTGLFLLRHTGNDKDFLTTRVSHVFDLRGPSITVQTACSTSLVAIHNAAQALLAGECDMALAGGVTIELPHARGYTHAEGEILSPDGRCRAFDAAAAGTVFGSGAGVVVLRRLADALADGDHIWAVLKGSAVNNDGAAKAGYLAPSVDGQAACIAAALDAAGIAPETVGYVECHGTGTPIGDPIEVAALATAFGTGAPGTTRLGSVKPNIGHLDTAAGVAGFIKATLALHHRQIPPTLHVTAPNPALNLGATPFCIADRLEHWAQPPHPRRASVNSLGVGGTNAHAVLQEAPAAPAPAAGDWPFYPVVLSARSRAALDDASARLAAHLRAHPDLSLPDLAHTLKEGRRAFAHRRVLVAETPLQAADLLDGADPRRTFTHQALTNPEHVFMYPGGGAQFPGMARDLYDTEPAFRDAMDQGLAILSRLDPTDIRALWLPQGDPAAAAQALRRPSLQLPLILITEIALTRLFQSWGVTPTLLVGHSMGEAAAACVAGVMAFDDAIALAHLRGTLFDSVPPGGMLSVPLDPAALRPRLGALDIAAVNAPGLCVISGPEAELATLASTLAAEGIDTRRIAIDIAAHSRMLDPILAAYETRLRGMRLSPPRIPVISNRTGQPLTPEQATDPAWWVAQLRGTVDFAACMATLATQPDRIFLEMGPGRALTALAQANGIPAARLIPVLRHPDQTIADDQWHMTTIARLWACGAQVDWAQVWGDAPRRRLPLPTYPFQRQRHFIEPQAPAAQAPARRADIGQWGWRIRWRPTAADFDGDDIDTAPPHSWLVFLDDEGLGAACAARLSAAGHRVTTVTAGDRFARWGDGYTLSPEQGRAGYDALVRDLVATGRTPDRIAHFWLVTGAERFRPGSSFFHRNLEQGFWSVTFLAQAMTDESLPPVHMTIVTTGAERVRDEPLRHPEKATIAGPARVLPREMPGLTCATLDVTLPCAAAPVIEDLLAEPANTRAALRGTRRLAATLHPLPLPQGDGLTLAPGSTVLVTGGLGGIALTLAQDLARRCAARFLIVTRSPLPPRADWPRIAARGGDLADRLRALLALESLGAATSIHAADVCNPDEMRAAIAAGTARLGPIRALIHAAGVVDDAPLAGRSIARTGQVLAPKLHGTQVIDRLFPDGSVDWIALFGSTSTQIAAAGQVDYVAANEYLNAWSHSRAGGRTRVVAINWGVWQGAGMAARGIARRRPAPPRPLPGPVLTARGTDAAGDALFTGRLTPAQWVIDGHRTRDGRAILPGTAVVALVAQALAAEGIDRFALHDLTFLRALDVPAPRDLRLTLRATDEGFAFDLSASLRIDGRNGWLTHAQGRVAVTAPAPATIDPQAIAARCGAPDTGPGLPAPQEDHLTLGPRWRVLHSRAMARGEGFARLALPPGHAGADLWVPVAWTAAQVHGPLPPELVSHVRLCPGATADSAAFDVTLACPRGQVCATVTGLTLRRLPGGLTLPPPDPRQVVLDDTARPLSPAEDRLARAVAQGIRPDEGPEAFARAMAAGLPQVLVSPLDLPALVAEASMPPPRPEPAPASPDNSRIAPRNDIERTLAGFWQDLLGVSPVGVTDDFFALGGHSLIALRLFARIRRAFRVDFPISVLFEAPTIAACAALIADRIGTPDTAPRAPERRFTHLVAMHDGAGGPGQPFFLVAGMFGNVLNLRHLAQLIGGDRPFWGLQAQGLHGDAAPHTSLPEAAASCIAELRQVQPHGPYLLGGFSGGGLTAWEMAHQLEQAGEAVALLALLDTPLPVRPALSLADRAAIKWQLLREEGPAFLARWARDRLAWERRRRAAPDADGFHNAAIEAAFRAALPRWTMPRRAGPTVLFRPPLDRRYAVTGGRHVSAAREYVLPDNALTPHAPALRIEEVPGDHDSMVLEPNVRVLATRLRAAIAGAERDVAPALRQAAE